MLWEEESMIDWEDWRISLHQDMMEIAEENKKTIAENYAKRKMAHIAATTSATVKDHAKENEVPAETSNFLDVSTDHAPTIFENNTQGNKKDATFMQGENSFDELILSTNHTIIEQNLVEPLIDLPFLQDNTFVTR